MIIILCLILASTGPPKVTFYMKLMKKLKLMASSRLLAYISLLDTYYSLLSKYFNIISSQNSHKTQEHPKNANSIRDETVVISEEPKPSISSATGQHSSRQNNNRHQRKRWRFTKHPLTLTPATTISLHSRAESVVLTQNGPTPKGLSTHALCLRINDRHTKDTGRISK